jgi:tetratricopeptide (TPR) repeat protein
VPGGQEALALAHPNAAFLAATFSPDGHLLAASHGSSLVLWNARPPGEETAGGPDPDQVARDWHEGMADKAEAAKDWYALAFHGRQLQALKSDDALRWYQQAIARLALGDVPGYRRTCADLLRHFAATEEASTASEVIYACAIDPEAGGDPKALVAVARRAVGAFAGNERALGAALCRAGDHAEALRQFEKAAANYRRRAWDWLFLALIHHGLHDAAAARSSYDEAIRQLSAERPFDWKETFEVAALKREAEQRLQIAPPE